MFFESAKDRKIRELTEENKFLREQCNKQEERLHEASEALDKAVKALDKELAKDRRSAFASEIGLLPCESPACKFCKNAVWMSDADGRHIAGCRKGIQCADFEHEEPKEDRPSVTIDPTQSFLSRMAAWNGVYPTLCSGYPPRL